MKDLLFVAGGGAAGAVARYLATLGIASRYGGDFPLPTLVVNVTGCFALGALVGWGEGRELLSEPTRLLLATGFLGAFTTFSTYAVEGHNLFQRGAAGSALAYLLVSVLTGVAAAWLGRWLIGLLA